MKTHVVLPEASEARTATAPHEPAGLVRVVPPKRVCELAGPANLYPLAAWPGGRTLLSVHASSTRMTIDEKGEAFVELTTPNFVVRGFVPGESHVHPAKWLSIDGVYFLTYLTSYPVVGTHDGKLTLDVHDPHFAFANPNDHLLDVCCDDVTLSEAPTEELRTTLPAQFQPGFGRTARELNFWNGLSISATFDGPPVGKTVGRPPVSVGRRPPSYTTVLETRGTKVRIADPYLAGWIDASAVSIVPASEMAAETKIAVATHVRPSHPDLDAECRPDDREPDPVHPKTLVCPRDVRLVALADEFPDRLSVMGAIPAGRPVRVLERTGDLTNVFLDETPEIPGYPLATSDGVHVATPTIDLDGCAPTTAFPFPSPEPRPRGGQQVADTPPDAIMKMSDDAIPHLREEQAIQNVVENQSDFALCYDEGLRKNPRLWGEVVASFVIGRAGDVTNVNELESPIPLRSEKIARCVLGGFASLRFAPPASKTKTTTVTAYVTLQ